MPRADRGLELIQNINSFIYICPLQPTEVRDMQFPALIQVAIYEEAHAYP
jgi:hypothetical protein